MQTLVIELGVLFLFRRGPRHVGTIEHSHRRGSPAAAVSGVLRRRESIGVRHPEAERSEKRPGGPHRPHFHSSSPPGRISNFPPRFTRSMSALLSPADGRDAPRIPRRFASRLLKNCHGDAVRCGTSLDYASLKIQKPSLVLSRVLTRSRSSRATERPSSRTSIETNSSN